MAAGPYNVQFEITVSGIGSRTIVVAVASAVDAEDAIVQAKTNLITVVPIQVAKAG